MEDIKTIVEDYEKSAKKPKVDNPYLDCYDDLSERNDFLEFAQAEEMDKYPVEFKLKLLDQIKKANSLKNSPYNESLGYLDWSSVNVDGYTLKECRECLEEILKPLSEVRTLNEILTDFERNHKEYLEPRSAALRYVDDHRDEIKKMLYGNNPDEEVKTYKIIAQGMKLFEALPDAEKAVYILEYKKDLMDYYKIKYDETQKKAEIFLPILNRAQEKLAKFIEEKRCDEEMSGNAQ